MLQFDRNGDGRIGRDEVTEYFTLPFRPELPPENPGFGLPLPSDPAKRKESQEKIFDWRDKNKDGFWTKEEFTQDMTVGQGQPNFGLVSKKWTVNRDIWSIIYEFECVWGQEIKGAVKAFAIIECLDVVEDGGTGLMVGGEVTPVNQLQFEGAPEALHGGMVVAVAAATHGGDQVCWGQSGPEIPGRVLRAPVGMEEQLGRGIPVAPAVESSASPSKHSLLDPSLKMIRPMKRGTRTARHLTLRSHRHRTARKK